MHRQILFSTVVNPSTHASHSIRRFSFETERLVSPSFSIAICLCALHSTAQHGTARHHKTPSPMLPLIPSNHPVNSPSSLTRVQQQSTPKSKDPDAKREARNITVSDTAQLHRRGTRRRTSAERRRTFTRWSARRHTFTAPSHDDQRDDTPPQSGQRNGAPPQHSQRDGHLHRMVNRTIHLGSETGTSTG